LSCGGKSEKIRVKGEERRGRGKNKSEERRVKG
jgi:hypothetical protein